MPPHEGLVHLKEYDVKDSNVELIGSDIDHKVKYNSALTEPAWSNGKVGQAAGLFVWRIEDFQVVPWPKEKYGQFYDGDSFIVLKTYKINNKQGKETLKHDIFFWLGSKTSQDEAGTAAYKTVELDEFLHGVATQHREIQQHPSAQFIALFPRITILSGGIRSGFRHVEESENGQQRPMLLRVFKPDVGGPADSLVVHEVEPSGRSLDENDVFILDKGDKVWVWQGRKSSPMEKAKAAQVVHDLTLTRKADVEVLAQAEPRSKVIVRQLDGDQADGDNFQSVRPVSGLKRARGPDATPQPYKLFRLSDASGRLAFNLAKQDRSIRYEDLDTNDIFLLDTGRSIWVWQGLHASKAEKKAWIGVAQSYARQSRDDSGSDDISLVPIAKVVEGNESSSFMKEVQA